MERLLYDEELYVEMRNKALQATQKKFSWQNELDRLCAYYKKALNESESKLADKHRKDLLKDFSWYLLSSFFPLLVGFVKTPIFTRHFSTEDFGNLGIVQEATFSYLGMLLFTWIASILWRYYQKYKNEKRLKVSLETWPSFYVISFTLLAICAAHGILSRLIRSFVN